MEELRHQRIPTLLALGLRQDEEIPRDLPARIIADRFLIDIRKLVKSPLPGW
jgi:hypothetical protein